MSLFLTKAPDQAWWELRFDHGKVNEMGTDQLRELEQVAHDLGRNPGVSGLISYATRVTSRGVPVFVAGANVTERVGWDDERVKQHVRWQRAVLDHLRRLPVLHVCVVHGLALGWGCEFTLTADYVIATSTARFGLPETGLGILPGAGGSSELRARVGPNHALRLGMTGEQIDAHEAVRIGLAQEAVPDQDAGLARARALVTLAATRSPTANAAFKAAVHASEGQPYAVRSELEAAAYASCVDAGEAAVGRAWFAAGGQGVPAWGPRRVAE